MLKDPLTTWNGLFPYDALAPIGVTPASSMRDIMDASFDLMAQGLMTPEVRQAWDELRFTQRRLLVDFFLYQVDLPTEIAQASAGLEQALVTGAEAPDVSSLLTLDHGELRRMEHDVRDIPMEPVDIRFLPEFDREPSLQDIDIVKFDS